jgi:hypothetical protein
MAGTRKRSLRGILILCGFLAAGCLLLGLARTSTAFVKLDDGAAYRITGPHTYENLSVYLIHSREHDERNFITLDQGLKAGVVKVSEKVDPSVRELQIDNQSDDYLFLQEGDRLKGGQQDRTIFASLVIPPHSGPMPLPAFCIERSRWQVSDRGKSFGDTANLALAPKAVRQACKVSNDQGEVWATVQRQKEVAQAHLRVANTNSSLNETLDSPAVRILSDEFANALSGVLTDQDDVVGVAIAINGKIEEVNIYPNRGLLGKLYPRLLQSYALEATLQKDKGRDPRILTPGQIAQFMVESEQKARQDETATASAGNVPPVLINFEEVAPAQIGINLEEASYAQAAAAPQIRSNSRLPAQGRALPQQGNVINVRITPEHRRFGVSRAENVNADNRLEVNDQVDRAACKSQFEGKVVHRQMMTKVRGVGAQRQTAVPNLTNDDIGNDNRNLMNDNIGADNQTNRNHQFLRVRQRQVEQRANQRDNAPPQTQSQQPVQQVAPNPPPRN